MRRAQIARMAELRRKLSDELSNAASLSAFDPVHDDLLLLQAGTPNDPALRTARQRIETLLDGEMRALTSRQAYDDAQALLARYADVVTVSYVETKRVALDTGRGSPASGTASADAKRALDALLQTPAADDAWDLKVHSHLAKLSAYVSPQDAAFVEAKQRAAQVHVDAAEALRSQGRLSEAERSL